MAFEPFTIKFGDLAYAETRSVTVQRDQFVPADQYFFQELFCNDVRCDCRRVLIRVVSEHAQDKVWATISYGWEREAFYRNRTGIVSQGRATQFSQPTLDPLHPQSVQAAYFLDVFNHMIRDCTYVIRLKRHYKMLRNFQSAQ